jgi:hypothetical protein
VPGYAGRRQSGQVAGDDGGAGNSPWHGSSAGKGPVRGYPPRPGQPPPMYPPGQFASWNRRGTQARAADGGQAGAGRPGAPAASSGRGEGSGYYAANADTQTDPGYSMLAVTDPAADVTSTQTWQAVGDGRATGAWTGPARPGAAGPSAGRPAGPWTGERGTVPGPDDTGPGLGTRSPQSAPDRPRGLPRDSPPAEPAGAAGAAGASRAHSGGRRGIGTGPLSAPSMTAAPGAAAVPGGSVAAPRTDPRRAGPGQTGRSRSGHRPSVRRAKSPGSAKLAVAGAVAIVLIGGAALYLGVQATAKNPRTASPPRATPTVSASPTPSLGPYGYIASRQDDPTPLTVAELYPASFTAGGAAYVRTRSSLSADCVDAVDGAGIQAAVSSAGCSQVARATYLATKTDMMGTIGVLNLKTARSASAAARAAGSGNFIAQLPGRAAPTNKIGQGAGIEEALAKGHYLILIWAELTSRRTPRKGTQSAGLDQFMTEVLDNTANVSLTNRMVNGSPSPPAAGA